MSMKVFAYQYRIVNPLLNCHTSAVSQIADFMGNAPEKNSLQSAQSTTSQYDHVDVLFLGKFDYGFGRIPLDKERLEVLQAFLLGLAFSRVDDSLANLS